MTEVVKTLGSKDIEGNLEAGHTCVFTGTMINFEFIVQLGPQRVKSLQFTAYKYESRDAAVIAELIKEVESSDCPVLASYIWLTTAELDPLYKVKQKAIADYLASVQGAAAAPVGGAGTVVDSGMATTKNVAVAQDPMAALNAAAAAIKLQQSQLDQAAAAEAAKATKK